MIRTISVVVAALLPLLASAQSQAVKAAKGASQASDAGTEHQLGLGRHRRQARGGRRAGDRCSDLCDGVVHGWRLCQCNAGTG